VDAGTAPAVPGHFGFCLGWRTPSGVHEGFINSDEL
jgi:hypothetical protein